MHSDHAKKSKDISKTSDKALSGFSFKHELKILAFGLVGSLIMAVNIKSFVHTGGLYPGGFNGVTLLIQTICQRFFGIALPFSPISLILNAIPAIFSFKFIGKRFTINTALIIVATSIFTDIVPAIPITQDILLISVFKECTDRSVVGLFTAEWAFLSLIARFLF